MLYGRQRPTIRLFARSLAARVHLDRSPTFRYSAARNPFDRQQDNNSIFGGRNVKCINCERQHFDPWPLVASLISLIRSPTSVIGPLAAWRQKFIFILVASGPTIRSAAKVSTLCSPPTITIRRFGPWPPLDRKQFDFDHKSLPAKVRFDRQQFDHWLQKFL